MRLDLKHDLKQILRENLPFAIPTTAFAGGSGWALWTLHAATQAPDFPVSAGLSALGLGAFSTLTGGLFATAAHHVYGAAEARFSHFFPDPDPLTVTYTMPPWPASTDQIALVLGESHGALKAGYSPSPTWYTLPALGLYTGTIALGATGSAKTAGVLRPALTQLLAHAADAPDLKPGALVMDYKASLVAPATEAAAAAGRSDDLLLIGPRQPVRWNPIHAPGLEPRVIAGRLLAILENLSGQSSKGDQSWIADGAGALIENAIGIIRLATGYITLLDLHEFVTSIDAALNSRDQDTPAPVAAADFLNGFESLFKSKQPQQSDADKEMFNWHYSHFIREFASQADKFRAIYVSEVTRITKYFADPAYRDLYSPAEQDIDFINFNDAIQTGKIVVLDANADIYGSLSTALGIFLKLDYQRAMLARPVLHRQNPDYNFTRPMLLVIDEYQEFVSTGAAGGDPQFFALSRESKAVPLVATQSRASLVQKIGEEKARVLLASLRTKVFLALTDPQDCEYAAKSCGEDWSQVENVSIGENVQQAGLAGGGKLLGQASTVSESRSLNSQKINRFEPTEFRDLPTFTAIVAGFDGRQALPPQRVLLKPFFRDRDETYREFVEGGPR